VIDVSNPEQKLKPGMTANLTITIDERNNVLKVPNSALRFTPQDAAAQKTGAATTGAGNSNGQGRRRQQTDNANGADNSASPQTGDSRPAPPTAPVLAGQTRTVWVLGADGKPQARRIKVGLTDGTSTEVVEGNLQEGEMVITGQTLSSANKAQSGSTPAPALGGAPRTNVPRGGR
jgi:HlyD family secretion protein